MDLRRKVAKTKKGFSAMRSLGAIPSAGSILARSCSCKDASESWWRPPVKQVVPRSIQEPQRIASSFHTNLLQKPYGLLATPDSLSFRSCPRVNWCSEAVAFVAEHCKN